MGERKKTSKMESKNASCKIGKDFKEESIIITANSQTKIEKVKMSRM